MASGGRYDLNTRGDDPLPTAETVGLAKGFAARACAERAADLVWVSQHSAQTWVERTPMLALCALVLVCPEVAPERLARCLGLDPVGVKERLRHIGQGPLPGWSDDLVAVIAQQIAGGV